MDGLQAAARSVANRETVCCSGPSQFSTPQSRLDFFQQRILRMVAHWRDHAAVQQIEIAYLDAEREAILKAISLGLDFDPAWPLVKALVIAFTPYMERRGHWDAWHTLLTRAIASAQKLADLDGETTLTALLARLSQRMSRPRDVVYYYRRAIRLARQTGNRFEEARACSNLGYLYIDRGRWWRSEVLNCHALEIFEVLKNTHGRAHTHNHLGILYIRRKAWLDAELHLDTACTLWREQKDEHSLIYGYENLGLLCIGMGLTQKALGFLNEAAIRIEKTGENSEIGNVWQNMAYTLRLEGRYEEAQVYARKAEVVYRQNSNILGLAWTWHNLAIIYLLNEDLSRAEAYRDYAISIYRQLKNSTGEKQLLTEFVIPES